MTKPHVDYLETIKPPQLHEPYRYPTGTLQKSHRNLIRTLQETFRKPLFLLHSTIDVLRTCCVLKKGALSVHCAT